MLRRIIGQQDLKASLEVAIGACRNTGSVMGHVLLSGPGGLGKSFILNCIGEEMGCHIVTTQGNRLTIKKVQQFLVENIIVATNMGKRAFLVIDEIHEMSDDVQDELFYPMDVTNPRILTLGEPVGLAPFTLAAATTDLEALDSKSLVSRFKYHWELKEMTVNDLLIVVSSHLTSHNIVADYPAIFKIASRSRGNPRLAIRYTARAIDYAHYSSRHFVSELDVDRTLAELGIDDLGLDENQRKYLTVLYEFDKPMGKDAIAATLGDVTAEQVSKLIEPYLWKMGLITSSNRGRELTDKGHQHILTEGAFTGEI